jgi:hypothetical protein
MDQIRCGGIRYVVEGSDTLWRDQIRCGGIRYVVEGPDTLWRDQIRCGGIRYVVEGTDTLWRDQIRCGGNRYVVEGSDTLWRDQIRCGGIRYVVEGSDTLWREQIRCGGIRYVVEGCCQDPEHVKNRGEWYFRDNMQRQLDGVSRSIKNFLFKTHRRNMRVLESSYNIRNLPNVDIWFTDPVHPIDSVYNNLAAGVIKMAATLRDLESRQDLKRRRADSWETTDSERRPRDGGAGARGGFPRGHCGRGGPRGDRRGRGGHQYGGLGGPRR